MVLLFDLFQTFPVVFWSFIGLMGLLFGSFLNVVIYRLPRNLAGLEGYQEVLSEGKNNTSEEVSPKKHDTFSLLGSRSHCRSCHHPILAIDNIPLLSFCLLKGRCRYCQTSISLRYPGIELLTMCLSFLVAFRFGVSVSTFAGLLLTFALIALAFIDIDTFMLPDDITLPMIWTGLLLSIIEVFSRSHEAILGAVIGYLFFFSIYWIFKWFTGKEGLGFGDFKLLAMLGAWLGWQALPFIVFLSSLLGAMVGGYFILIKKQNKNIPLPFGPFLATAGFVALMVGAELPSLYHWVLSS